MKFIYKLLLLASVLLVLAFNVTFYVMPSITIINNSKSKISSAKIALPSSNLDFGSIDNGESNVLHYDLSQPKDGSFRYHLTLSNGVEYQGVCGYVTSNEINKRVIITIRADQRVTCNET